jgi:hypothetical protein
MKEYTVHYKNSVVNDVHVYRATSDNATNKQTQTKMKEYRWNDNMYNPLNLPSRDKE